jgi:hypothetical protein
VSSANHCCNIILSSGCQANLLPAVIFDMHNVWPTPLGVPGYPRLSTNCIVRHYLILLVGRPDRGPACGLRSEGSTEGYMVGNKLTSHQGGACYRMITVGHCSCSATRHGFRPTRRTQLCFLKQRTWKRVSSSLSADPVPVTTAVRETTARRQAAARYTSGLCSISGWSCTVAMARLRS